MQFLISPEIFARFPGMHLAIIIAKGIDNQSISDEITAKWHATWKASAQEAAQYGNAQSHPRVQPWRERFRASGVSGKAFPSSIEALLRRALKGGEPFSINALVDFYNTISLRYTVPAGGFDLDAIQGPLELRLTREGDTFMALDEHIPMNIPPGEVAYTDGQTILTRHFVWRQAQTGLIKPSTHTVFLVSEVLGEVGQDVAEAVLADLQTGVQTLFNVPARSFLLNENNPVACW